MYLNCLVVAFGFLIGGQDGSSAPNGAPSEAAGAGPVVAGLPYPVFSGNVEGLTPARLLHKVEPKYSKAALEKRQQGTVVVRMVIDANGDVARVIALRPLGLGLDENAVAAVKQWKFKPALKDGLPVAMACDAQVNFHFVATRIIH